MGERFEQPVLMIVFNRPDTTRRVFSAVREVRPARLFVSADAPRKHVDGDTENCARVREIVAQVDWDCDVRTRFSETNLGCGPGPSSAITWFFSNVEQGVILEDDCVPHRTFFTFCDELLNRYADDERIMHILGTNLHFGHKRGDASYFFSKYPIPWGWASWRRAWQHFDFDMTKWLSTKDKAVFLQNIGTTRERVFWKGLWQGVAKGRKKDIWDAQWAFTCITRGGLTAVPNVNLVRNVGFGSDATHHMEEQEYLNLEAGEMSFPLVHPRSVEVHGDADKHTERLIYTRPALPTRIFTRLKGLARLKR